MRKMMSRGMVGAREWHAHDNDDAWARSNGWRGGRVMMRRI